MHYPADTLECSCLHQKSNFSADPSLQAPTPKGIECSVGIMGKSLSRTDQVFWSTTLAKDLRIVFGNPGPTRPSARFASHVRPSNRAALNILLDDLERELRHMV